MCNSAYEVEITDTHLVMLVHITSRFETQNITFFLFSPHKKIVRSNMYDPIHVTFCNSIMLIHHGSRVSKSHDSTLLFTLY